MEKQASHSCVSLSQPSTDVSMSLMASVLAQAPPAPAPADAACMNSLVSLLDQLCHPHLKRACVAEVQDTSNTMQPHQ